MLYSSNFDDSKFKQFKQREFNHLIDDPCAIQQQANYYSKKLKYMTTNNIDLIEAKEQMNFYGMTLKDGLFVPADLINEESFLKRSDLTNQKCKNEYGQLPLSTIPARYQTAHGNLDVGFEMRSPLLEINKHSNTPVDTQFYNRVFYIFNAGDTPKPENCVEKRELFRGGVSSRF